jgi:L1 cell adhesion molecule like protein
LSTSTTSESSEEDSDITISTDSDSSGTEFPYPTTNVSEATAQVSEPEQQEREVHTIKLCGDNFDKTVKRRYMRSDKGHLSLHYFHSYAVLDRIDLSGLPDSILPGCFPDPNKIALELLPSASDDIALEQNFAILVSRVLATHFKFFKFTFDDVVQGHIEHKFSAEMAKKSVVVSCYSIIFTATIMSCNMQVPLGMQCKNETKGDDMVDIMSHLMSPPLTVQARQIQQAR